ncbi:glycosyltransferase [Sphingobacterium tabacisoli]|uniref:Glycosyltransferase n=1 Tax=Sphingobacterium tabacisoli TaxID=2044855 RepID=A0ABW5LAS3_9SPHI|nr:glycosyltransferase [Sphingobacterium tabacisoli]
MKTIVISAVNIVEAGPLAILRNCLHYLSELAANEEYKVVALVYERELAEYPNITYIETKWPKKNWINRLWYEYVSMKKVSKTIGPVYLWFSLHDTSPRVEADLQAVYCHNSFTFYKWKWRELLFAPKIVLFSLFTKYIYGFNVAANRYLVVQQEWFREAMAKDFNFSAQDIIVARPQQIVPIRNTSSSNKGGNGECYSFLFPASPNSHKNFECLCEAVAQLDSKEGLPKFKVYITITGKENSYTRWIFKKWGNRYESLCFIGFLGKESLLGYYEGVDCLVFPSKTESWGLPISEFANYGKPMLLADLPYARETAAGSRCTAFFDPDRPDNLAAHMEQLIMGEATVLAPVPEREIAVPVAEEWSTLFNLLLNEQHEDITSR